MKKMLPPLALLGVLLTPACTTLDNLINELDGRQCVRVAPTEVRVFDPESGRFHLYGQSSSAEEHNWVQDWRQRYDQGRIPGVHDHSSPITGLDYRFDISCREWQ